jgi:hypothetical protein
MSDEFERLKASLLDLQRTVHAQQFLLQAMLVNQMNSSVDGQGVLRRVAEIANGVMDLGTRATGDIAYCEDMRRRIEHLLGPMRAAFKR